LYILDFISILLFMVKLKKNTFHIKLVLCYKHQVLSIAFHIIIKVSKLIKLNFYGMIFKKEKIEWKSFFLYFLTNFLNVNIFFPGSTVSEKVNSVFDLRMSVIDSSTTMYKVTLSVKTCFLSNNECLTLTLVEEVTLSRPECNSPLKRRKRRQAPFLDS
jgi:hypothetical protein